MNENELAFLARLRTNFGNLAKVLLDMQTLYMVGIARNYHLWTDQKLIELGYTRTEIDAMFALVDQVNKFMNNQDVTKSDRWKTIHTYRTDI